MIPELSRFEDITTAAFAAVCRSFGLQLTAARQHIPDLWIEFANSTTGVRVTHEIGSALWVELARVGQHGGKIVWEEPCSLEMLLEDRAPGHLGMCSVGNLEDPAFAKGLEAKGEGLRDYAADVLRGDFGVFPRLIERARENERRWNRELFGSPSGETPKDRPK